MQFVEKALNVFVHLLVAFLVVFLVSIA